MSNERTFIIIKPDGIQKGVAGNVLSRLEHTGLKIVALKFTMITEELASKHYEEHIGKDFYPRLLKYITSGPVIAGVMEGPSVIQTVRDLAGATDPADAMSGTIRGDHGSSLPFNIIHASDSPTSAAREIGLYFKESDLIEYTLDHSAWLSKFND